MNYKSERMRELLDERGVEWRDEPYDDVLRVTAWTVGETLCEYNEIPKTHHAYLEETINPCTPEQAVAATLGAADNPPYDELLRCLENDYDIKASWDGLRKVWLTESADAVKYGETRWYELFGTPERAVASLCDILTCTKTSCDECCINEICDDATHPYDNDMKATLLEWLRGKAVG